MAKQAQRKISSIQRVHVFSPMNITCSSNGHTIDLGAGVYEKELAYEGTFFPSGKYRLDLDEQLLRHWNDYFHLFKANGNDVPVYIGHVGNNDPTAPTKRRGSLIDVSLRQNQAGKLALYGKIRLAKDADILSLSQVSVHSPARWSDGHGNIYHHPITHVAITDVPVIPGLEPFQAISLSLSNESLPNSNVRKEKTMNKAELAAMYGLDEATLDKLLSDAMSLVDTVIDSTEDPTVDLADEQDEVPTETTPETVTQVAELEAQKEALTAQIAEIDQQIAELTMAEVTPSSDGDVSLSNNPAFVSVLLDNRRMKIDQMLRERKITPVQRTNALKQFCNAKTAARRDITLAYQQTMTMLDQNAPVVPKGGSLTTLQQPTIMKNEEIFKAAKPANADGKFF